MSSILRPLVFMIPALLASACSTDAYFNYSGEGLRVEHIKGATCSSPRDLIYLLDASDEAYMYMSSHAAFPLDADLFVSVTAEKPVRFTSPLFAVTTLEDNVTHQLPLPKFGGHAYLDPTAPLTHGYPKGVSQYWTNLELTAIPRLRRFTIQFPPVEVGGKQVVLPLIHAERKTETYLTSLCLR